MKLKYCVVLVFVGGFALPAEAHDTRSARRLEADLAKLSIRIGKIESKMRTITGKMEEVEHLSAQTKEKADRTRIDAQKRLILIERDLVRIKSAVKQLIAKRPTSGRRAQSSSSRSKKNTRLDSVKTNPDALFNYATDQLFTKKNYREAQRAFELFSREYPNHRKAGEALYWLGESFYVRGNHRDAASAYLRSFNSYGNGSKAPDSLLKLGMSLAALNEWEESCATFDKLRSTFPAAPQRILQRLQAEYERTQCRLDNPRG